MWCFPLHAENESHFQLSSLVIILVLMLRVHKQAQCILFGVQTSVHIFVTTVGKMITFMNCELWLFVPYVWNNFHITALAANMLESHVHA